MTFAEYRFLVYSDLYRSTGRFGLGVLCRQVLTGGTYKFTFWWRTCGYARTHRLLRYTVYPLARLLLHRLTYRQGISIPIGTRIGSGFYIAHFGGIVVNGASVLGRNCDISQGVTLGQANRGRNLGVPTIGDNVYIGPGAKVVGAVRIGNNVAIGANCVVTRDVPDDAVVVGVPGRIISSAGSAGYIGRTDYAEKIGRGDPAGGRGARPSAPRRHHRHDQP